MTVEELQIIISSKTEKAQEKIKKLKDMVSNLQPKKSTTMNVSTSKAQGEIKKVQAEIDRTQSKINKLKQKMGDVFAKQDTIVSKYADVPAMTGMTQPQTMDYMIGQDPKMKELNAQISELEAEMAPLNIKLSEAKAKIAQLGDTMAPAANKTNKLNKEVKAAGNNMRQGGGHAGYFGRMVKSMLVSMMLYSGISFLSKSISEGMQNMALGSAQANSSISQLATSFLYVKNSIAAAFLPALQAVQPILVNIMNQFAGFMNYVGMLNARIFNNATSFTEAKIAYVDYAKTLRKTPTLAGFDQINTLNKANPGMPDPTQMFKSVKIPGSVIGLADKIKSMMADVTAVVSGALLAVGAILLFTGANVPLGLGLMAVGAVGLAADIAANWNTMSMPLRNTLTTITSAVGGFLLALGAILAFSGANVPLGIGLMAVGAASIAAAVALNWGIVNTNISAVLSGITGVVSGAMLALGALFALSGANIPFGIGLMLIGAVGIASEVALNWDGLSSQTRATVANITAIVGGAMLALGAILAFSGVALPLGIGLMFIGALSLGSAAALNWSAIEGPVRTALANVMAIASTASLAIGILLCLTGAGIPLGIGLILAGAAGMGSAQSISSTPITNWAKDAINGVIGIFESGINSIIQLLNKVSYKVPDWVAGIGGKTFGINIAAVHIPRMATGGVVKGATPLIAGEDGAEAIVPLERNTGWTDGLVDKIAAKIPTGASGNINLTIPIYLDRNGDLIGTIVKRIKTQGTNDGSPVFG